MTMIIKWHLIDPGLWWTFLRFFRYKVASHGLPFHLSAGALLMVSDPLQAILAGPSAGKDSRNWKSWNPPDEQLRRASVQQECTVTYSSYFSTGVKMGDAFVSDGFLFYNHVQNPVLLLPWNRENMKPLKNQLWEEEKWAQICPDLALWTRWKVSVWFPLYSAISVANQRCWFSYASRTQKGSSVFNNGITKAGACPSPCFA